MKTRRLARSLHAAHIAALIASLLVTLLSIRAGGQQPTPRITPAAVAESTLDARTRAVAAELRCPVCQGLSLQDSPSELSQQMRDVVRQQLAAGKTEDEVRQYFVARYGEWILMSPSAHGFNWLVYLLPMLVLMIGGGVVLLAVKRWTSGEVTTPV
jgi:cytochrome c-type biogenesis protein CcmH